MRKYVRTLEPFSVVIFVERNKIVIIWYAQWDLKLVKNFHQYVANICLMQIRPGREFEIPRTEGRKTLRRSFENISSGVSKV